MHSLTHASDRARPNQYGYEGEEDDEDGEDGEDDEDDDDDEGGKQAPPRRAADSAGGRGVPGGVRDPVLRTLAPEGSAPKRILCAHRMAAP